MSKATKQKPEEQMPSCIFYSLIIIIGLFVATTLSTSYPILPWIAVVIAIIFAVVVFVSQGSQLWPIAFALIISVAITIDYFKATDITVPLALINGSVITVSGIIFGFSQLKNGEDQKLSNPLLFYAIFISLASMAFEYTNFGLLITVAAYGSSAAVFFAFVAIWLLQRRR